jgi:HEAT repeat protein
VGARFRRLLKIHTGEEFVAKRMLVLMLLVWAAATIGASGIESLLFSRYGPHALPYLFIVLGVITLPAMARLGALLQRTDRQRILSLLPLALGVVLLAGRALMLTNARWVYPVLWLLMMVVWIMEATGAWAVASLVNDTRQAKRLFPLYGAGQIVGGAAGGLLTVPLARTLHAENLVLLWAAALIAACFLVRSLLGSGLAGRQPRAARSRRPDTTNVFRNVQRGLRLIRSSSLLGWLAVAMVLFALLYNSLSFIFAEAVSARFASTDSLAAFIGLFNALINGAALIVSLFVANRLFARFGVATMVLSLAVIYLVGFTALSIGVSFAVLVVFRLIQMVWVNGVWITGWQALFTIVPPERRGQVTSFMDGAAWEAGMTLAGGAIIVAEIFRGDRAVFFLGVVGSALLIFAMWRARRAYGPAVAEAVRAGRPDVFASEDEPFGGFRTDAAAVATLLESAADPDPDVRRVAIVIAADLGSREVLPAILEGAADDDPEVRAVALRSLAHHPDPSGSTPAAEALSHADARVRAWAVEALVACSANSGLVEAQLRPRLTDSDARVRARAAGGLVRAFQHPDGREELVAMLSSPDSAARAAAVETLGDLGEKTEEFEEAVSDADPEVRRAAVRALARFAGNHRPRLLISALGDSDTGVRDAAVAAITGLGTGVVDLLEDALTDPRLEPYALRALHRIGGAHLEAVRGYAREQVVAATHYGRLALRVGLGDERVELLTHSLKSKMDQHATNALWANAAFSDSNRLGPAIESLTSSHSSQRATALEAIETLGEAEIVRPLLAFWEKEFDRGRDIESVLHELLADDDPWLRACAALASESLPGDIFGDRLRELSATDLDSDVRTAARLALEGVDQMETLDTLPLMRRVLFLRKVALFAELTPADLKSVANAAVENLFPDGELIAAQGEPGGEMHVVVVGEIEVDFGHEDALVELARRGPGEVVGEMSLITEQPRMASLVAVGNVRTLSIDRTRFERIIVERPEVSLAVMRQLCARLMQSVDKTVTSH